MITHEHIYMYLHIHVLNNYIGTLESTNKILRFANIGASYKDTMESITKKSMRRNKKIYCRPYHKDKQ